MMSHQSSDQDSSLEAGDARKEDRPSSSHLSTLSRTIQMKKNLARTSRSREMYTMTASGSLVRTPSNLAQAQDKGLQFWQTKSRAMIVCNPVPADCIQKVISQKGERTLYERLDASACSEDSSQECLAITPQAATAAAPRHIGECFFGSTKKLVQKEDQGTPTDNPEPPSMWKQMRSTE